MPTVDFNLVGAGKIPGEYDAIANSAKEAADAQGQAGGAFNDAAGSAESLFNVESVVGWIGQLELAERVLEAITAELERQQDLIDRRAAVQIDVSASRNEVLRNLGGLSDEQRRDVLDRTSTASTDAGLNEAAYNAGFAAALQGAGGDVDTALGATTLASQFLQDRPGEVGKFASSLAQLDAASPQLDSRGSLGLAATTGNLAGITNTQDQVNSVGPALAAALESGAGVSGSAGLFAALARSGGDRTGGDVDSDFESLVSGLQGFGGLEGGLRERIGALRQNPELAARFFKETRLKRDADNSLRELLDPESELSQNFDSFAGQIPGAAGLAAAGSDSLSVFGANEFNPVAQRDRSFENAVTRRDQGAAAVGSLTRDQIARLEDLIDGGLFDPESLRTGAAGIGDGVTGTSVASGIGLLEDALKDLLTEERGGNLSTSFRVRSLEELPPEERATAGAIEQLINELKAQQKAVEESQKDQAASLKEIAENTRDGGLQGTAE